MTWLPTERGEIETLLAFCGSMTGESDGAI